MKKILFSAFPVLFMGLIVALKFSDPLAIGAPIPNPEVKMKDISGKEVSFRETLKKNGLLVMFSCNTCPVVGKYQSRTLEIGKYATDKEIGVILLNSNEGTRNEGESFAEMQSYAKEQGYTFNYALDNNSTMADAFGAARTPEIFLFNKEGKLAYHGAIDDNPNGAENVSRKHAQIAIDELVSGKEVSTKQTRSVGCSIKRAE